MNRVLVLVLRTDGSVTVYDPATETDDADRSRCWPIPTIVEYDVGGIRHFRVEIGSSIIKPEIIRRHRSLT